MNIEKTNLAGKCPARGATAIRAMFIELRSADLAVLNEMAENAHILPGFALLDARTLADFRPNIVVAPLWAGDFDIIDVAARLEMLGYRGLLYALTRPLPNSAMVRAELCESCKGINIRLLELPR